LHFRDALVSARGFSRQSTNLFGLLQSLRARQRCTGFVVSDLSLQASHFYIAFNKRSLKKPVPLFRHFHGVLQALHPSLTFRHGAVQRVNMTLAACRGPLQCSDRVLAPKHVLTQIRNFPNRIAIFALQTLNPDIPLSGLKLEAPDSFIPRNDRLPKTLDTPLCFEKREFQDIQFTSPISQSRLNRRPLLARSGIPLRGLKLKAPDSLIPHSERLP